MPDSRHMSLEPFPSTEWTLIARADQTGADRQPAMADLLHKYLGPMKSHLVLMRRLDPHQADDMLQGFLATQVLERRLLRRAERAKGRFRSFLLVALNRYVSNQLRDARARHRSGTQVSLQSDCEAVCQVPCPDASFDLSWARQVLDQAVARMKSECLQLGRPDLWGVFEARVLQPAFEHVDPLPYQDLVARFGLASPAQASNVLMTAKRMFNRLLRSVVAEYAGDDAHIDREILDLREILARRA